MPPPGTRLGIYEITAQIGAGGMGEVYQARDTTLNRDVALKVLPESFAKDSERLARFRREAQTLASLNHPHIAQIYGLEESSGALALVMELVDGEDLAMRLKRGPIPIDEALPIARQIADGLEAAHEQGIVHRDLKPANIKVRNDGTVKVLDFGLAKAVDPGAASGEIRADQANSPTITSPATLQGVILGTAAYMSPEQAKGRPVDRRTDIWAFGCVLYEMLSGARAFDGDDVTDILGSIVKTEPDWTSLPATTPASIQRLLKRCLAKDRLHRLQHIGDARLEISDAILGPAPELTRTEGRSRSRIAVIAGSSLAVGALLAAAALIYLRPSIPAPDRPPTRFVLEPGPGESTNTGTGSEASISRDGRRIAAMVEPRRRIRVWSLDQISGQTLKDTESAENVSFSPDGKSLVFRRAGEVWTIGVDGSLPHAIGKAPGAAGSMNWTDGGDILVGSTSGGLQSLPAAGGAVHTLIEATSDDASIQAPFAIPGTDIVLYTTFGGQVGARRVKALNLRSGEKHLIADGLSPRYLSSGYLMFGVGNRVVVAPFDRDRLQLAGEPAVLLDGVTSNGFATLYAASDNGVVVHVPQQEGTISRLLVWVDRTGKALGPLPVEARSYEQPRLSPDGSRLAIGVRGPSNPDVWLMDLRRNVMNRFTFDPAEDETPLWSPDGLRVLFRSAADFRRKPTDSSQADEILKVDLANHNNPHFASVSPDGKFVAMNAIAGSTGEDVIVAPLDGRPATVFAGSKASELAPSFSPDGKWLAYASDESGRLEIYVRAFPGPGGQWQVSTDGGTEPVWAGNGKELFYRRGRDIVAVAVSVAPSFSPGKPVKLFEGDYTEGHRNHTNYDVTADGQRFLMIKGGSAPGAPTPIQVAMDMLPEFRRLAPRK